MPRLLAYATAALSVAPLSAQTQGIQFYWNGAASGVTARNTPSQLLVRAGSALGSHAASVPLPAGAQEAQIASALVQAAAANQIGIAPVPLLGPAAAFQLTSVDGAPPARGCLFGSDDSSINSWVAEISGGGSSRFFGCAFPKANTGATSNGIFSIEVVGPSVLDGHLFGAFSQAQLAAGDTASVINTKIKNAMVANGCSVFDIALPSFGSALLTQPGFGIDRFDGLTGAQVGHQFRVAKIVISWSGAAASMPKVAGLGWFPTGGFAEYGTGHATVGPQPYIRGEGDFAPGGSYDVVLEYGRPSVGLLTIATARAAVSLPGGGTLLLDPQTIVGYVPFHTTAHGHASHSTATPADPGLIGQTMHYQGFAVTAGGFACTSGLYCRIWQ